MVGHVISASSFNDVQATPPPPSTYTVQPQDKDVPSIAQAYNLTPEELARANNISVDATLSPGQVLTLPANAVLSPPNEQPPSNQSLQQQTDAAVTAYMDAAQQDKQTLQHLPRNVRATLPQDGTSTADSKYQALNAAIQNEIAGEIVNRYGNVPAQFRPPTDQLEASLGQAIVQRYQSDPVTQQAVSQCVTESLLQSKVNTLVAIASGNASPHDKLQSLSTNLQGQPQDVINDAFADPTVQGWVQSEANQVAQPYATVKPGDEALANTQANDASNALHAATTGLSPSLAAAVTEQSIPTLQKIAQAQPRDMVAFDNVQGTLANLSGSDQANTLTQQIADAYAKNSYFMQTLLKDGSLESEVKGVSSGNPSFAFALSNSLRNLGQTQDADAIQTAGLQGMRKYLANSDASPLKQYEAAHSVAEQKDHTLYQMMLQSTTLTPDQQQDFIKAYRGDPDNAQADQADADTAKTLATYMQNNQTNLIFAAGHDPAAAQQLYGAMQDLAQSGQGEIALRFAGYVNNDPAASKAFNQFSDYHSTFETKAVQSALGQLLVEKGGDPKTANTELLQLADPVFKGRAGWNQVKESLANNDFETNPLDAKHFAEAYEEMGASGKAWAIAAVTVDSLNGATTKQVNEMIGSFSMAGGDISEVGSGALNVMAEAGKFGSYNVDAELMSKLSARFAPGLGVIASTSALSSDWEAVKKNPDSPTAVAYGVAIFGDGLSVLGSFMENVPYPPAQIAGMFANGAGVLISAPAELIGRLFEGDAEGQKELQEFQEEQVKYLQTCRSTLHEGHITKDEAEAMAKDGNAVNTFADQLGIDPTSAQKILNADPEAFNQDTQHTQAVVNLINACHIQPGDAGGFLSALAKDNPSYADDFYNQVSIQMSTKPLTNSSNLVNMIDHNGYANAKVYVQSHAPGVFSPDGYARRKADLDFESPLSGGGPREEQIGNYLKTNGDAAYQAEMINIMKNNGTLGTWVQAIANDGSNWKQTASTAIQNAQNAEMLSAGEAQQYLNALH